jgi:ribonuclease P protein component
MRGRFLSKQHIRTLAQFQRVYQLRQRFPGRFYVLYYRDNQAGYPRLGVVASNRNVRTAVVRNLVKRLAREAFRHHQQQLQAVDIIIVAKADAATASKRDLHKCLEKLFSQLIKRYESSASA